MKERFQLSDDAPLPPEIKTATEFLRTSPDKESLPFWASQLQRLKELVGKSAPMQADWEEAAPASIRSAPTGIKAVATQRLLTQLGLVGSNWIRQFIYGFGAMGTFSQDGVSPPADKTPKPCPPEREFEGASDRFDARAKASGWAHIDTLWSEALGHVSKGWLERTHPAKGAPAMGGRRINAAFRFAVVQMVKSAHAMT